mgnify:CR=1 FL=1
MARVKQHPILGTFKRGRMVTITVDGRSLPAREDEPIAAALLANGISVFRFTEKSKQPRGLFCGIGLCTDCKMIVDGVPNVRTCITPVKAGMVIQTQWGRGKKDEGTE